MLHGMERWHYTGRIGNDTDRNGRELDRLCSAGAGAGSSGDERLNLELGSARSRSNSLPTRALTQREYLDSLRALAQAYSVAERNRSSGGYAGYAGNLDQVSHVTRPRSATMIDTRRNRGRLDSELTSDSDRTFDLSPRGLDSDVFATTPVSEDEKAKIINSRLHELDSAQRSWKKRVADYVHGLPTARPLPGEGGRMQDPKRRRLWSTGCDRLPWEINSSDGVAPRQRITTVSSDSTFSCSQLSTSSSRDSIQHWVDSIDGQEDPDATLVAGQLNGDGPRRRDSSPQLAGRKISDHGNGGPKLCSNSVDDELRLGADAESVTGSTKEDGVSADQVVGPGGKVLARKLTNSEIINMAAQTRALQSRRKQLQRMGSSAMSDASVASVSDLLFARNDPEELLLSLGFGGGKEHNPLERIPSRFLQGPSNAKGISVHNFLMLSETQDQKFGFSLHGGLRGLGAVLQSSMCATAGSSQYPTCRTAMGGTESQPDDVQSATVVPEKDGHPSVEPVQQTATSNSGELPIGRAEESRRTELLNSRQGLHVSENELTNGKPGDLQLANCTSSSVSPVTQKDLPEHSPLSHTGSNPLFESGTSSGCELYISDSSDSDWDYEEVDPSGGGLRSSEDHRRSRVARMVMPQPLLPPVCEELEVTPALQSQKPTLVPTPNAKQETKLQTEELSSGKEHRELADGRLPKKGAELSSGEKKVISLTPDWAAHRLTHNQESFEIEEISSTENQEEGGSVLRAADKVPEKGPLVRTDSAQSDSSGFADEVMDSTITSNSPCIEDCNGLGSPGRDYSEGSNKPEVGNKLIQTSFDDLGVLESFDRDEYPGDHADAIPATATASQEEEKTSESEKSSSLSSAERIARSRKSFRESRGSYDRMGSTFSGISVSSMEDSPFDGEGPALQVKAEPVPRQRSGTYPAANEKQETSPGPKTVVEILTTLQENIKQAAEAESLLNGEKTGKKRPILSKMKSVDFEHFPLDDIPTLMESVEAIVGRTKQSSVSPPTNRDTQKQEKLVSAEDVKPPPSSANAQNGVTEETGKSPPKLLKRKSSQLCMVPTLPCLDEEKTPAHSRHSSVTDTPHVVPKQNSSHSLDKHEISNSVGSMDAAQHSTDGKCEDSDGGDLRSGTDTPVSMVVNVDSIGDVGDLEEEMRYLEQVESLLLQEGRLLEEASPIRHRSRPKEEESRKPPPEEPIVQETQSSSQSCPTADVTETPKTWNHSQPTVESSSPTADQLFHSHSGTCQNLSNTEDSADLANSPTIPVPSCSIELGSQSAALVESSVCLYLSPTPFVIDFSEVPTSNDANVDGVVEQLCNSPDTENVQTRFRTSFELALDGQDSDENCEVQVSASSTESVARLKPEDDLNDMKLIQRALLKYKQDLCELESLAERLYARHLDEDQEEEGAGMGMGMTERERAELDSVRGLRRQVLEEVEIMEGRLTQRMRLAVTRSNLPDGLESNLVTATEDNLEVIQEMVNLLEEQRTLRRMLQDLESTHSHSSISEASTIPDLSAVGSGGEWAESYPEEAEDAAADKREMMQALREVRMELQHQREMARREMNSAVKEMRQAIISELRQELQLDAQLFQRQLQAKDKEIEQLKALLREQRILQDGE